MKTKTAALYDFWSSFGLPAYDEASVPTGDNAPAFPYLTYEVATSDLGSAVALTASLWYRSSSWADANKKAAEISNKVGRGGIMVTYQGGAIWITRGRPFAQSFGDTNDNMIKRKVLNISTEFLSEN